MPQPEPLDLAAVDERLEVTLRDGRRLRLAGIEPPPLTQAEPNRPQQAQAQLSNWLRGVSLRAQWLSPQADRWNRWPVRLYAAGRDGQWMSVAEALVDAGLVRVAIDPLARPCLGDLLQLEEGARKAELGLWRDPDLKVLPADNRTLLLTQVGRSVIIEGRVEGTGEGRTRLYVNFGRRRAMDFSAVLLRKQQTSFGAAGVNLSDLTGKILRIRGLLESRTGPQMMLHDPEAVEITGAGKAVSPKSGLSIQP